MCICFCITYYNRKRHSHTPNFLFAVVAYHQQYSLTLRSTVVRDTRAATMEMELSDRNTLQENTQMETRKPENPEATKAEKMPQIIATLTGIKFRHIS